MKKIGLLSVNIFLCIALLIGCGSTSPSGTSQSQGTDKNAGDSAATEPGTFPIVKDKVTLKVFFTRDTPPANWEIESNWFTKYYEEKTNVHIEWEMVTGDISQRAQKVNLKLASGDYPDIFSMCAINRSQQAMYGSQGVFIPLNDMIEKDTVNIKQMFNEVDGLKDTVTAPDGNIYGLPNVVYFVHGTTPNKMWVNNTWLTKLNLETPKTTDDFYKMLKAFKEQDPNGNGKADEVPLASQGLDIAYLMNSFVYYDASVNNSDNSYAMVEDGKIKFIADTPEFKEGLKYIKKLVEEGLYAADSITMDRTQRTSLAMKDPAVLGAATALWPGHFTNVQSPVYKEGDRFWEYKAVAPLEGPTGLRQTPYTGEMILNGGSEFNITKNCKDPEVAMRWVDWFYGMEGFNTGSYGPLVESEDQLIEGVAGWRKAAPDELGADGKPALFFPYGLNNEVNVGWQTGQVVPRYQSFKQHTGMTVPAKGHYEQMLYDATVNDYWPYKADKSVPPLYMQDSVASEFTELKSILNESITQSMAQFITGVKNIDSDWDKYVDDLNKSGLKRYMEIYQSEYDRNNQK